MGGKFDRAVWRLWLHWRWLIEMRLPCFSSFSIRLQSPLLRMFDLSNIDHYRSRCCLLLLLLLLNAEVVTALLSIDKALFFAWVHGLPWSGAECEWSGMVVTRALDPPPYCRRPPPPHYTSYPPGDGRVEKLLLSNPLLLLFGGEGQNANMTFWR